MPVRDRLTGHRQMTAPSHHRVALWRRPSASRRSRPGTAIRAPMPRSTSVLAPGSDRRSTRATSTNAAAPIRMREVARHHRCTSPDVYDNPPADLFDAQLAVRDHRVCTQRHRARAPCVAGKPDVRRRERGCETQTRARDEHVPATFRRRANRAANVDGAKRERALPARHLDAAFESLASGLESKTGRARFPNVSTPSQRSTPPRTDARAHDVTQSDSVTCAPRRRDVGIAFIGERLTLRERIDAPETAPRRGRGNRRAHARTPGPVTPAEGDALAAAGERAARAPPPRAGMPQRRQALASVQRSVGTSERSAIVARSSTSPDGTGTNVSRADAADGSSRS